MEFFKIVSEVTTVITTIFSMIGIVISISSILKKRTTNVNTSEDKKTLSDYVQIYGLVIWSLILSNFVFFVIYMIFTNDKNHNDLINLFIALSAFIAIFIAMIIGFGILRLNHKYSAEIYIYNKLIQEQYELYIDKCDEKIKNQEYFNKVNNIDKPTQEYLNLFEELKKELFKKPKIVTVYNWLSILFILLWGFSISPLWIIYEDLNLFTKITFTLTMVIPILMVAYRLVSLQKGKLKLTEYEINKHIKRYKRQYNKNNRTKKHVRTFTVLNYEITFNKLRKGSQNDEN
ncbi:hypothetical protein [Mammaliicoccus sciuri]|uniref:hypothetical protein n=1 Tax=Mammaliicoccus sciuri TaxID=1296 RepID=UPI001FB53816|nr:hypothetical protein [Mammaliicoccus sciuri]MCJ0941408.1 hypothetical protein [Mammaliicoccus sciuri]